MPAYRVRVVDSDGELVVGATLFCPSDAVARAKFAALPLPAGAAELTLGKRIVERRVTPPVPSAAGG